MLVAVGRAEDTCIQCLASGYASRRGKKERKLVRTQSRRNVIETETVVSKRRGAISAEPAATTRHSERATAERPKRGSGHRALAHCRWLARLLHHDVGLARVATGRASGAIWRAGMVGLGAVAALSAFA